MLFDIANEHLTDLPMELQELFTLITFAEFDVVFREKKAFEEFYNLLNAPDHVIKTDEFPTWKQFVDKIAALLAGNHLYANLREALVATRNKSGWTGKISIGNRLKDFLNELPRKLQNKIEQLGITGLARRIK